MVEVGMGQYDRVDFSRVHRQRVPVAQAQLLEALEQAAIEQHLAGAGCQQVFGAGHGAGGAEELYVRLLPPDPVVYMTMLVAAPPCGL
jgi:uncharacterized phosphosugar-binding protein